MNKGTIVVGTIFIAPTAWALIRGINNRVESPQPGIHPLNQVATYMVRDCSRGIRSASYAIRLAISLATQPMEYIDAETYRITKRRFELYQSIEATTAIHGSERSSNAEQLAISSRLLYSRMDNIGNLLVLLHSPLCFCTGMDRPMPQSQKSTKEKIMKIWSTIVAITGIAILLYQYLTARHAFETYWSQIQEEEPCAGKQP